MQILTIVGFIGNDAQENQAKSTDKKFWTFNVAVNRTFKDQKLTTWYKVFNTNPNLVQYLTKGKEVAITGNLLVDTYVNSNNEKIVTLQIQPFTIQLVGTKSEPSANPQPKPVTQQPTSSIPSAPEFFAAAEGDKDDLPF